MSFSRLGKVQRIICWSCVIMTKVYNDDDLGERSNLRGIFLIVLWIIYGKKTHLHVVSVGEIVWRASIQNTITNIVLSLIWRSTAVYNECVTIIIKLMYTSTCTTNTVGGRTCIAVQYMRCKWVGCTRMHTT